VEEILLHSQNGFALGQPSDTMCFICAVAAVATTDENLSRVRMDCAHKMRFVPAQVNFMS